MRNIETVNSRDNSHSMNCIRSLWKIIINKSGLCIISSIMIAYLDESSLIWLSF